MMVVCLFTDDWCVSVSDLCWWWLSDFAAQFIGKLEINPNADLAQVRSDIDQLIEVIAKILWLTFIHIKLRFCCD